MNVIITGGRDYSERTFVYETLDTIHKNVGIDLVIQGGATGADALAKEWAISRKVKWKQYDADWKDLSYPDARIKEGKFGKYDAQAGHRRNHKMLSENKDATLVVFPGGAGTRDCVRAAIQLGMKIT
jgi:predicted Rossmann-fold nucleotide-binding protein